MDQTVVITGATSGIGRAVAEEFVERGAFVAICGRDEDPVATTVTELIDAAEATENGGEAWGMRADVRDEFDMERFMEGVAREAGSIDVVIANAATVHGEPGDMPMDEEPYASFDDTVRTNARGVFTTITEALPHLANDARVLVPSGAVAHESRSGMGSYAVSKAAAEGIARGFAADISQTVGVVDPGIVHTELTGKERARDPASVAPLFVWAATDAPTEDLNGKRLDLRTWKDATR